MNRLFVQCKDAGRTKKPVGLFIQVHELSVQAYVLYGQLLNYMVKVLRNLCRIGTFAKFFGITSRKVRWVGKPYIISDLFDGKVGRQ